MDEAVLRKIGGEIHKAQRIVVISHIRPDGDAIGSLLGLGTALRQIGKEVQMVSADGVPSNYRHLPGSECVIQRAKEPFDLVIVVDCSDLKRIGKALDGISAQNEAPKVDINIDHHITNLEFARVNLVVPEAVATAEVLTECLQRWNVPITSETAASLVTGIVTDTLGFRTANVTPKAMRTTADLMESGVNMPELYMRSLVQRSYEAVRFWSAGLSTMEKENGMVWATLTQADRQVAGYSGRDDADLINVLSSIGDADITMIFVEQPGEGVKVSWRAKPGFDVSQIALRFGGGGHPAAAGAEIPGTLEEVRQLVLQETRLLLVDEPTSQPA